MSARQTKGKANAKRLIIDVPLALSDTETSHECATLRMAQAIARCEAAKCQAGIRAGRMAAGAQARKSFVRRSDATPAVVAPVYNQSAAKAKQEGKASLRNRGVYGR